jgi:hypothetical protein
MATLALPTVLDDRTLVQDATSVHGAITRLTSSGRFGGRAVLSVASSSVGSVRDERSPEWTVQRFRGRKPLHIDLP